MGTAYRFKNEELEVKCQGEGFLDSSRAMGVFSKLIFLLIFYLLSWSVFKRFIAICMCHPVLE